MGFLNQHVYIQDLKRRILRYFLEKTIRFTGAATSW